MTVMVRALLYSIRRDVRFLMLLRSIPDEDLVAINRQLGEILRGMPSNESHPDEIVDEALVVLRKITACVDRDPAPGSLVEQLSERIFSSCADAIIRSLRQRRILICVASVIEPRPPIIKEVADTH